MNEKQKNNKIDEFFNNTELSRIEYESVLIKIVDKFISAGFGFFLDFNSPDDSGIDWTNRKVRHRMFPDRKPLHNIWILLHEYGHYLQGEQPVGFQLLDSLPREEEAWDYAYKEIVSSYKEELFKDIDDFFVCKDMCLVNYRRRHQDLLAAKKNLN